jgi:VCBS repeat-containing protein
VATDLELALMAGRAYESTKHAINKTPTVAAGWSELVNERALDSSTGFEATCFQNGDELVISFAGTDPANADMFPNPSVDMANNIALKDGNWAPQLLQAAEYFLQKIALPGVNQEKVTLTGHSLGGGLAALIGVFFNVQTVTFNQAPFAKSATALSENAAQLLALLKSAKDGDQRKYSDAVLSNFDAYRPPPNASGSIPREKKVKRIQTDGEILNWRIVSIFSAGRIGAPVETWTHGGPTGSRAEGEALHSQTLLTAFMLTAPSATSETGLAAVSKKLPGLLPRLQDKKFYDFEVKPENSTDKAFLEHLVQHEVGGSNGIRTGGTGMLTRFVGDMERIAAATGFSRTAQDALIAQAAEWYYWQGTDYAGQEFFLKTGDFLQFTTAKGAGLPGALDKADAYVRPWLTSVASEVGLRNPASVAFDQWNVALSDQQVNATARYLDQSQAFIGGGGNDNFTGGAKNDFLAGGAGADTLDGGGGDDSIYGGGGTDVYRFIQSHGKDRVFDSDGKARIEIDGVALTATGSLIGHGNGAPGSGSWGFKLNGVQYDYTYRDKQLTIGKRGDTANSVTIENFNLKDALELADGYMGIKLVNETKAHLGSGSKLAGLNSFSNYDFDPNAEAEVSQIIEGGGVEGVIYLNRPASPGDVITFEVAGLENAPLGAVLGDETVPANGATITLTEGQTEVHFALVQNGQLSANVTGTLRAIYHSASGSATTNSWTITLKDTGEVATTVLGDRHATLSTDSEGRPEYSGAGTVAAPDFDDVLYASFAGSKVEGLGGNDVVAGRQGNDQLDGGAGNDLIAGGAGSDSISGGEGADRIFSSRSSIIPTRLYPGEQWMQGEWVDRHGQPAGVPEDSTIISSHTSWGTFRKPGEQSVLTWGIGSDEFQAEGDVVDGGGGNDFVIASSVGDRLQGGTGSDELYAMGGADILEGGDEADTLYGDGLGYTPDGEPYIPFYYVPDELHGNDFLDGGAGVDTLYGGGGADVLYGGSEADFLFGDNSNQGGLGNGAAGADYLNGEGGDDRMYGGGLNDVLYGGADHDTMYGDQEGLTEAQSGEDYLDGGSGNDRLVGGFKSDRLYGGDDNDQLFGDDFNFASIEGSGDDELYGGKGDDILRGGDGHDYLAGGDDSDFIVGDGGNDMLVAGSGVDRLLGETGDDLLDTRGGGGAKSIDGGAGYDTAILGWRYEDIELRLGSLLLYNTVTGDEVHIEGFDHLDPWNTVSVEAFELAGDEGEIVTIDLATLYELGFHFTGTEFADLLVGLQYDDVLSGLDGDDELVGAEGADTLDGGEGQDLLLGGDDDDTLYGGANNDQLDGGAGADAMAGQGGDDFYIVDSEGDVTIELAGEGTDTVTTTLATYTLADNVERLIVQAVEDAAATGNDLNNEIVTGSFNDTLAGLYGNDTLRAGEGDDVLLGGDGNDELRGEAGTDAMDGGHGDDAYYVGDAGDSVSELDGSGMDTVHADVESFELADGIENLVLYAQQGVGIGNALDNAITGSNYNQSMYGQEGNDTLVATHGYSYLEGGEGNDTLELRDDAYGVLVGGAGDDTYRVNNVYGWADLYEEEGAGYDRVLLGERFTGGLNLGDHIEEVDGSGGSGDASLFAGAGDNILVGGAGRDQISGGGGNDTISGGEGGSATVYEYPTGIGERIQSFLGHGATAAKTLEQLLSDFPTAVTQESDGFVEGSYAYPTFQLSSEPGQLPQPVPLYVSVYASGEPQPGQQIFIQPAGTLTWEGGGDFQESSLSAWDPRIGTPLTWEELQAQYGVQSEAPANPEDYLRVSAFFPIPGGEPGASLSSNQFRSAYWPRSTLPADAREMFEAESPDGAQSLAVIEAKAFAGADTLDGGDGDDVLDGGSGNDLLLGGDGADDLYGGDDGSASLVAAYALEGATVTVEFGKIDAPNNDTLDGGAGIDRLRGGTGDDTYYVGGESSDSDEGRHAILDLCDTDSRFGMEAVPFQHWLADTVIEQAGEGNDTVIAQASVVLENIETVMLAEDSPVLDIDATTGAGSQTLIGNSGKNTLAGGAGADTMEGGQGDDTYVVDDAGDVVTEWEGEGVQDIVRTTLDGYVLGDNLEVLLQDGTADLAGSGNALDNILIGNDGHNTLAGGEGNDTLAGWLGNDLLQGGAGWDGYVFARGHGNDVVEDAEGSGWLHFSAGITQQDLNYTVEADDLIVSVAATEAGEGVQVTLRDWMVTQERIDWITFCDDFGMDLNESAIYQPPIANSDAFLVTGEQPLASGNLLDNDVARRGNPLAFALEYFEAERGTLTVGDDGSFEYLLEDLAWFASLGADEWYTPVWGSYAITEDSPLGPLTAWSNFYVDVVGVNDGPEALDDTAQVAADVLVASGNVVDNDFDIDNGDTITFASEGEQVGEFGTVQFDAEGNYAFVLDEATEAFKAVGLNGAGLDAFQYTITDSFGATATATLNIAVQGLNDGPEALDDAVQAFEDGDAATGNVLDNDSDVDVGDTLAVADGGTFAGTWGTLELNADGSYTYGVNDDDAAVQALGEGETVTETFSYAVTDDHGAQATAQIDVTITGVNDGPVAEADQATAMAGGPAATGNALVNDSDIDNGDVLSVASAGVEAGAYGTLDLAADGSYSYTVDEALIAGLSLGQTVVDTFDYTVQDSHGATAASTIEITITGSNEGPVAEADSASALEDGPAVSGNVLANDSDVDTGDVLTVTSTGEQIGEIGSLALAATGDYTYTLDNASTAVQSLAAGQTATDSFTYVVRDIQGATATSTVEVTVTGVNDGPVAEADTAAATEDGPAATGNVLANDSDIDTGDVVTVTTTGEQSGDLGSLELAATGDYTYALDNASTAVQALAAGQTVTDSFAYTVQDTQGASATASIEVTVTGVNDGPMAGADAASAGEDGVLTATGNVLANDSDIDTGDTLSVAEAAPAAGTYGNLVLGADGAYSYTLDNPLAQALAAGQQVVDQFSYTAQDSHGATASATLAVTITGVNDGPEAASDAATVREDTQLNASGNLLANDSDVDAGDTLSVGNAGSRAGTWGNLDVATDGSYTYALNNALAQTLGAGQTASETFSYTARDGQGALATANLAVTIQGVNDGPVAVADSAAVAEDAQLTASGNVLTNDSDIDTGDTLRVSNAGTHAGQYGSLTLGESGSYTYALNNAHTQVQALNQGQSLTDNFSYAVVDSQGASANATLQVTIAGANESAACGLVINGTSANDTLTGTDCADRIDGKQGADTMKGGKGDDVYIVDQAAGESCEDDDDGHGHGDDDDDDDHGNGHDEDGHPGSNGKGHTSHGNGNGYGHGNGGGDDCDDDCESSPGDVVVEAASAGIDTVAASVNYVLPQHVENLLLTGSAQLSGTGNAANNVLVGNAAATQLDGGDGNDVLAGRSQGDVLEGGKGNDKLYGEGGNDSLYGGAGNDKLWGGSGNDTFEDTSGNNLVAAGAGDDCIATGSGQDVIVAGAGADTVEAGRGNDVIDGGAGNDTIVADRGNDFIAGGLGNDTITAGTGKDVIAFNRGDGKDILKASGNDAKTDTLSLGGGIRYADLTLKKNGSDLVLGVGEQDQITAANWYTSSGNRTIGTLQIVTVGGDYNASSSNSLTSNQVVDFDFTKLTTSFDQARGNNSNLVWSVAPSLAGAVVAASNTQALGGDLAFDYATTYATTGSLGEDMNETAVRAEAVGMTGAAQAFTPAPSSGSTLVDPWVALQAGTDLVVGTTPVASNPITPIESPAADALLFAAINASDGSKPTWASA